MLTRRDVLALATAGLMVPTMRLNAAVPEHYKLVWSDEFKSLSLRTGGPTERGLQAGKGIWSAPGSWWTQDPKGVRGYAYDWLVDPSYHWPDDYKGPFLITKEGLRIRSEAPPPNVAALLPKFSLPDVAPDGHNITPWLSGQIDSWYAVRIKPPFYFECRAKMPHGIGRPWPAIWLMSGTKRHPFAPGKDYEMDLHEGFGDSDKLHCAVHWNPSAAPDSKEYLVTGMEPLSCPDLSANFNTWGCLVTAERQHFYFNDKEIWQLATPPNGDANQAYGIILDVTAGIPWKNGGPPSDGPHDMIVRYVRLYAENTHGLILNNA